VTALTARNVHLTDQVLAVLAESGPLPISTKQVTEAVGLEGGFHQAEVWRVLARLAKRGEAEKIVRPEMYCRYWRLAEPAVVSTP
jgi:hypothetical protein